MSIRASVGAAEVNGVVPGGALGVVSRCTLTRPANTTTYASGDVIDQTTAGTLEFAGCALVAGGTGMIADVVVTLNENPTTKPALELWLFDTPIGTDDADNAVFTPTDAELLTLVAVITIDETFVADATSGANGNWVAQKAGVNRRFKCAAGATSLYPVLVCRAAYVPAANSSVFTIDLKIEQDG